MLCVLTMELCQRLEVLRATADLSTSDVWRKIAAAMGDKAPSEATVRRWFNGGAEPRLSEAVVLAKVLGVSFDAFAADEGGMPIASDTLDHDERTVLMIFRSFRKNHGLSAQEASDRLTAGFATRSGTNRPGPSEGRVRPGG